MNLRRRTTSKSSGRIKRAADFGVRQKMKYPLIRNQLGAFLHQDYDLDAGSAAGAIFEAIRHSDCKKLVQELNELEAESDEIVREVLNDHSVDIFARISPRDLLRAMIVFAELFDEEREIKKKNA